MNNKKLKIIVIILTILTIGLTGYIIYDKITEKDLSNINDNVDDKINNANDVQENNNEKKGHTLSTSVGKFIVDKNGEVYYINEQEKSVQGTIAELTNEDLSILGKKQKYLNYTYQPEPLCNLENEGCEIEAYKLNLNNISSVYEISIGNSVIGPTIIFLTYNGEVNELTFNLFVKENKVILNKNISKYPNIVSIVKDMDFGGHGAFLIDKSGNKYDYYEIKNNNKR